MQHFYQLHGLRVASDRPLLHISESGDAQRRADMHLFFEPQTPRPDALYQLQWETYPRGQTNEPGYRISTATSRLGTFYRMSFSNGEDTATFILSSAGDAVWVDWQIKSTDEALTRQSIHVLLNSRVWGIVLRLRGLVCLHGNVVGLESGAIAILGESGAGKSTLATALLKHRYPSLADDRVVLQSHDGVFWAQPGAPHLSLWPDTLAAFELDVDALGRVIHFADKRVLPLSANVHAQYQSTAVPLRAVYILEPRQRDLQHSRLERLTPVLALRELMLQRFGLFELPYAQATFEYHLLASLAKEVPLYRVHRPDNLSAIPELVQLLSVESEHPQPFMEAKRNSC